MSDYDVVVIGGGPGGYVAAIRAAQLGLKTACVEKRGALGGTCLNVGCIPSKALLQSSHHYEVASHEMDEHGISAKDVKMDVKKMMARKDKVVHGLTSGIEGLFKKHKIEYVKGTGSVTKDKVVKVTLNDGGSQELKAKNVIIATGSEPASLPGLEFDEKQILSSTGALALEKTPKKMVVVGAGYIGLEMATVWQRLGAEITVVEFMKEVLPFQDKDVRKEMHKILSKKGLTFMMGHKVTEAKTSKSGVKLTVEPTDGGDTQTLDADVVLVSAGRRPFTQDLGLEEAGVELDQRGFVKVDDHWQTKVEGIFAIGDVIGGAMLAHKAEDEGMALAEQIAGIASHVNYDAIPGVVYTWPEVAGVGKTEDWCKENGVEVRIGKFPFMANSRSRTTGETDGFVKMIADAKTDTVIGCHIVGPSAGDLIMEVVLGMEFGASAEDIMRTCHAHPGYGEAVREAALATDKRPIHI